MSSSSKPDHVDLGSSRSFQPPRFPAGSPAAELAPPRLGEVPPALSPLDAFAFQGQMLASRFEEENGRRMSRLPHSMIASEFARPRPGYPTYTSANSDYFSATKDPADPAVEPSGTAPELSTTSDRHRSFYPAIQNYDDPNSALNRETTPTDKQLLEPVSEEWSPEPKDGRLPGRSESPDSFADARSVQDSTTSRADFYFGPPSKVSTNDSLRSTSSGLAPPAPGAASNTPRSTRLPYAMRPQRGDSGDDSDGRSLQGEGHELRPPRAPTRDRPRSPFSPTLQPKRSPSVSSEISNSDGPGQPRRSVNFSRPMSPAARLHRPSFDSRPPDARPSFESSTRTLQIDSPEMRPSIDVLSIQESITDSPALALNDDGNARDAETASLPPGDDANATSYIYTKYALPRGRKVMSRTSMAATDWLAGKFDWDRSPSEGGDLARTESAGTTISRQPTVEEKPVDIMPEPQSRPSTSKGFKGKFIEVMDDDEPASSIPHGLSHPELGVHIVPPTPLPDALGIRSRSFDEIRPSPAYAQPSKSGSPGVSSTQSTPTAKDFPDTSVPTLHPKPGPGRDRTKSDVRGRQDPYDKTIPSMPDQMTAEAHLAKGIEAHEAGSLQKSTYHLRLAARAGHPTAMLLYALACRHGWGMRPNQAEGIVWLRKAVDLSKMEVGNDQILAGPTPDADAARAQNGTPNPGDAAAKRAHKAQLALSIYELGMSYMNGWGIAADKQLALRCFEIGGGWGDADALAEAGFCYAKGLGCKKDLFKAADFYRRAEQKGISMAGNSWIYKDKYLPKDDARDERKARAADKDDKKKKPRDKSRTRTFFGGKKKAADTPPS